MRYLGYQFIDFTTDYPLSIGLSSPEENGQWSDGKSCLISLKLENFIQGDAKLEFNIEPYVNNKHNLLKVNIYSIFNGRIDKITTWVFEHNKDYNTKFTISSDITKQGQCDLLFKFDSPCIPCEWSGDLRKLGIFFKSIKISSCQ